MDPADVLSEENDEESDGFDQIPITVLFLVAEKLDRQSYVTFNFCSKHTANVCRNLPFLRTPRFQMKYVITTKEADSRTELIGTFISADKKSHSVTFRDVPKSVPVKTTNLTIWRTKAQAQDFRGLIAEKLIVYIRLYDLKNIERIVKATKTRSLAVQNLPPPIEQFEGFPGLREIKITEPLHENCDHDEFLAALRPPRMIINGINDFTPQGVFTFLEQWVNEERRIESVFLSVTFPVDRLMVLLNKFEIDTVNGDVFLHNANESLRIKIDSGRYSSKLYISKDK